MQGRLFDSDGRGRRPFLRPGLGLLTSAERLRRRQGLGWGIRWVQPFGGPPLEGGTGRGLGLVWGLCMNRSQGRRSPCTHSFSTIGGRWL